MSDKKPFTVRDLPREERPRERLKRLGAEALSPQELLAIIISRGSRKMSVLDIAQTLLNTFGSINAVSKATIAELDQIPGIGPAKAIQIKASFELGKRKELAPEEFKDCNIDNPKTAIELLRTELKEYKKEHFKLIMLNSRNKVIDIADISTGTLNASLVHPREVFEAAIKHHSASVILVHNHPSGDPEPSDDDLKITKKLVESGKILSIDVVDHIIIGKDGYYSFKEKKLI
ncbi:MAG: DNA repair protein RadC [Candidatus Latescibacteria bacterium]|nr:DNA repair protein RadC [Candidatus Latescibacterota bacterium]